MDILLIEDDLRMAELISIGLRDNGHNVRLATDEIDGYMQYIAIHPLKQNFQCLKARYKKRRHLDSHRCTATTQTQNKTRQNYYAILPVYAGEAYVLNMDIHIYISSFRLICIV